MKQLRGAEKAKERQLAGVTLVSNETEVNKGRAASQVAKLAGVTLPPNYDFRFYQIL
jgi:hypothetical protein